MTIKAVFLHPVSNSWILVEGWMTSVSTSMEYEEETWTHYGRERLMTSFSSPTTNFDLQFSAREYTVVSEEWVRKHYPTQYEEELDNRKELE